MSFTKSNVLHTSETMYYSDYQSFVLKNKSNLDSEEEVRKFLGDTNFEVKPYHRGKEGEWRISFQRTNYQLMKVIKKLDDGGFLMVYHPTGELACTYHRK